MFVMIFFVATFLIFPFLENYFTNKYIDITILEDKSVFDFGIFKFNFLFTIILNLIVSTITILVLSKVKIVNSKLFIMTAILLNLALFVWLNYHIGELIFFPFGYISVINTVLIISFFSIYWSFKSRTKFI